MKQSKDAQEFNTRLPFYVISKIALVRDVCVTRLKIAVIMEDPKCFFDDRSNQNLSWSLFFDGTL